MARPSHPPSPAIADEAVRLRPWRAEDAPELAAILGSDDPELARWLESLPRPYTEIEARAYVERCEAGWRGEGTGTAFAVCDAATGRLLAWLAVKWERAEEGVLEIG